MLRQPKSLWMAILMRLSKKLTPSASWERFEKDTKAVYSGPVEMQ